MSASAGSDELRTVGDVRVVHQHHAGPMASIYLWFDVGTVDERDGEHGAAHLLEHMLFKGTRNHGVGEVAAAVEALGGDLNAYTVWDQTVLHATVLEQHWKEALHVLSEMAWHSLLDPDELEREKLVVCEEIRGYANDPSSVIDDRLTADLFPEHPYGRPVLGTEDSVLAMSRDTLHGFWRRHYGASRCVVGVVGPMDASTVEEAVAGLEVPPAEPRAEIPSFTAHEPGIASLEAEFETPFVVIGYRCPGGQHADVPAIEVLAQALGGGRASILQRSLRFERRLVNDIWASTYARREQGTLEVGFVPAAGKTDEALAAVLELLDSVRVGVDSRDTNRARNNLLADRAYASESVDSVAHDRVWFAARAGDPNGRRSYDRALAQVDAVCLSGVAGRYLQNPVIRVLDPNAKPKAPSFSQTSPGVHGIWISGSHDGWTEQGPILSVYVGIPGGRLAEPEARAGLADAWAASVTCGAGDYDSVALANELDRIAGSIRAIGGRNTLGIQLKVPAVDARRGLELLRLVVQEPRFEASDWDRNREEYLFDLDTLNDRPDEVLARRLAKLTFPDHPWGRVMTKSSLRGIHPAALREFHRDSLARGIRVGVAGRCAPELLEPLSLEEHPVQFPRPVLAPLQAGRFTTKAGHDQGLVVSARRCPPLGHSDQPALAVAIGILGAQSGRLFMELRERNSLAYAVWAHKHDGIAGGLFSLGLATDPERTAEARKRLGECFDRLADAGPTPAELERTQRMLVGQFATGQQHASSRAAHLTLAQLYGHVPGLEHYRSRVEGVTRAQVSHALQSLGEPVELTVRP